MHDTDSRRVRRGLPDWLLAIAVFLTLGAIYIGTLLPGLGGTEDTAKFQYIGPALGTPHDPGYPLYMMTTWAASKVPIGTLAYRINLLSAFWGALAAAFVFLSMRRLAVSRPIAFAVAIGMGLGRAFWEHSTYAEVYTQASAFTAIALNALLAWDARGRERDLYFAVAATSLAFGTHLIIVGAVPVFMWLVLTQYRWRVPLRVIVTCGLIVALGVAQYGYVWLRTVQGARYLEARAYSVGDLVGVLRGRQFEGQTFKESPLTIARSRIPDVGHSVRTELGLVATGGALIGVVAEWRRRRRSAILLTGAFLGPALLLSMLGTVATEGIMLPALMPLWALVGAGVGWLWTLTASIRLQRVPRAAVSTAVILLAVAIPAGQARANFTYNNRRGDTFDTEYFNDLFRRIPGRTAFLDESYVVGQMLEYQRYVNGTRGMIIIDRDPHRVEALLHAGFIVYAFADAAAALDGRLTLREVTLSASSLNARLANLPDGYLVVIAGGAHRWPSLDAIGATDRAPRGGRGVIVALKGYGPIVVTPADFEGTVDIARGQPLGQSGAKAVMDVRVEVRGFHVTIAVDGQTVVRSSGGLAVAELGSRLWDTYVLNPASGLRPPIQMSRRPLFQVTGVPGAAACTDTGDGRWQRLVDPGSGGRLFGRIDNVRPFDADWAVYLAADSPLHARLGNWSGPGEPALEAEAFLRGNDSQRLRARLAEDGLDAAPELLGAQVVTRLRVKVNDQGESSSFRLNLGGQPTSGWGRALTDQQRADRAITCAVAPHMLEPEKETGRAAVHLGTGGDWLLGPGWQKAEPMLVGFQRVLRGTTGRLLLPIAQAGSITLRISAEAIGSDATVAISLNGASPVPASRVATAGWNELVWTFSAAQWRAGMNDVVLTVTRPGGAPPAADEPSLRVRAIELDWGTLERR